MKIKQLHINVRGIVQGVGFRPFVYSAAVRHGLSGEVENNTEGVFIKAEGADTALDSFMDDLKTRPPKLSRIRSIEVEERPPEGLEGFAIIESRNTGTKTAFYAPDVDMCPDCRREVFDKDDRRYLYPLITCINCGPRFSIVTDVPYDRENTSMNDFPLCEACMEEYTNPADRRFHAEPVACHVCGPRYSYFDREDRERFDEIEEVLSLTVKALKDGKVAAIKGMGGYHLAVDAGNDSAVEKLRVRKGRPFKPFALMAGDVSVIEGFMETGPLERELLVSRERPIVLLKERVHRVGRGVAPGLSHLGVMLPSTPFQHMLFDRLGDTVLVMTSGNLSEEPIVYDDTDLRGRLGGIADCFVTYNRAITGQTDDSVIMTVKERPFFIRRSRGYVPAPFNSSETDRVIFAAGGDLKNSFAFARKDFVIMGQYLGDMGDPETYRTYRESAAHFMKIFDAKPNCIVRDMHPGYLTSAFADEMAAEGTEIIQVQHHHAHIASVLEDNDFHGKVIGVAFDGTGYGTDGTLWGSEFLIADRASFERAGHFGYFPLPGGESAIRDVWKTGASLLYGAYGGRESGIFSPEKCAAVYEMIEKGINSPLTCSIGRLFDGISAILGIRERISTEAEAAVLLEELASHGSFSAPEMTFDISKKEMITVPVDNIVESVVSYKKNNSPEDTALAFHRGLADAARRVCILLREVHGIHTVALSGGVFHNRILLGTLIEMLEGENFKVLLPVKVPANDGGIALGQLAAGKAMLN